MKNWRTTIAGSLLASPFLVQSLLDAYTAGYFTDKTGWQLFASIGFIILSALMKDHNVTGGTKKSFAEAQDEIIGDRPPKDGGR